MSDWDYPIAPDGNETECSRNVRKISLGKDFGDVVVKANGAQVRIGADGSVDVYGEGPVREHPAIIVKAPDETGLVAGGAWPYPEEPFPFPYHY